VNDELSGARCAGSADPDMWFRQDSWREAKAQCMACPVRATCLQQALDFETTDYLRRLAVEDGRGTTIHTEGVWGGVTAPQRRRIIDQRVRNGLVGAA